MAVSATTATLLSVGATLVGSGISALGSIQQGKAAANQASFQAAVQQQQAQREREIAAASEEDFRRRQSRLLAARRAAGGASGVRLEAGSPLLASEDFAAETELMARRIRAGGETQATRLEQQASLTRIGGVAARRAGFSGAGSSLLGGIGRSALILRESPLVE